MSCARIVSLLALSFLLAAPASAQRPGRSSSDAPRPPAYTPPPEMPGSELEEPFAMNDFQGVFKLTDDQANAYRVVRDSFVEATREHRDSTRAAMTRVREAMRARDEDAAKAARTDMMAHDRLLKKSQQQFDDRVLKTLLTKDQAAEYKVFRKTQEEATKTRTR